jgi:hypothetical protein
MAQATSSTQLESSLQRHIVVRGGAASGSQDVVPATPHAHGSGHSGGGSSEGPEQPSLNVPCDAPSPTETGEEEVEAPPSEEPDELALDRSAHAQTANASSSATRSSRWYATPA